MVRGCGCMRFRERIISTFEGKPTDKIVWQPRIEKWYEARVTLGDMPVRYRGMSYLEICDNLEISPRYFPSIDKSRHIWEKTAVNKIEGGDVKIETKESEDNIYIKYSTPLGELNEIRRKTVYGISNYTTDFPVKNEEDMKIMNYILEQEEFKFDPELFKKLDMKIGDRGVPIAVLPHAPLMRLMLDFMGFERTVKMLWTKRETTEDFLRSIEANDAKIEKAIKESPYRIVNFADNVHHDLCSPPLFKKYMLPNYQRRTREMHAAGKFCISHWDGYIKKLLPLVKETGLDALECVTCLPQGDVDLDEIQAALDGMVFMDVMAALWFLPWSSSEELRDYARKVIEMFQPRLILGIGDMLPPNGDIEKIRVVGEVVKEIAT